MLRDEPPAGIQRNRQGGEGAQRPAGSTDFQRGVSRPERRELLTVELEKRTNVENQEDQRSDVTASHSPIETRPVARHRFHVAAESIHAVQPDGGDQFAEHDEHDRRGSAEEVHELNNVFASVGQGGDRG